MCLCNPRKSQMNRTFVATRAGNFEAIPEELIKSILRTIGEDPEREGLLETPHRVIKSYSELFSGYSFTDEMIAEICKTFEDGACDELVVLKNVEFQSFCEHHMLPFYGKAHFGYLPDKRVIGLSKMGRILDIYSKRLQIQERLTQQITKALMDNLKPRGAACVVEAHHQCMSCRGVKKQNSIMVTSSMVGEFRTDATLRAEFLSLLKL